MFRVLLLCGPLSNVVLGKCKLVTVLGSIPASFCTVISLGGRQISVHFPDPDLSNLLCIRIHRSDFKTVPYVPLALWPARNTLYLSGYFCGKNSQSTILFWPGPRYPGNTARDFGKIVFVLVLNFMIFLKIKSTQRVDVAGRTGRCWAGSTPTWRACSSGRSSSTGRTRHGSQVGGPSAVLRNRNRRRNHTGNFALAESEP